MNTEPSLDLGCAALTNGLDEHPAGSAPTDTNWLLMELAHPWPAAINQHPELAGADLRGVRVVAIESPDGTPRGDQAEVILYRRPEGMFRSFERSSATVKADQLAAVATAVAEGGPGPLAPDPGRDVLVCTHEARDVCCGQRGPALLAALPPVDAAVWRCSHLGGHRFAPTMIDFPSGLAWANLNPATAAGALEYTLDDERINRHLRGCVAFSSRPAQAADVAAIARNGWAWIDAARDAIAGTTDPNGVTQVEVSSGARTAAYTVREGRHLPVPICQQPLEDSQKSTVELLVD